MSAVRSSGSLTFVIINPVSGPARRGTAGERMHLAADALAAVGLRAEILLTQAAGHAYDLAKHAVGAGADLVIAWGGDGTINEVGRALAFSPTSMGIVPAGSGNGLARELGIPFAPSRALEHALITADRQIDAAEIDGRLFFNVAGIGLDAHVAARVNRQHRAHGGLTPYVLASSRAIFGYTPLDYVVRAAAEEFRQTALLVAIANSRQYGYGARIAPTAILDDGALELVIVEDRGLLGNLTRLPFLMTGGLSRRPGIIVRRVTEVTVSAATPMAVHVDGEPVVSGATTLTARVCPGALRVRA